MICWCVHVLYALLRGTKKLLQKFKHTLFFNLLLPPIILNSGYELKQVCTSPQRLVFSMLIIVHRINSFEILVLFLLLPSLEHSYQPLALGELSLCDNIQIHAHLHIRSVLTYLFRLVAPAALVPNLTLLECLIFGSTLSATDPVTILAVFTQYKVDPHLYSVIFGESILNDAVSIVMYETLSKFHGMDPHIGSFFHGVGIFLLSFTISMALGVMFGLGCSLALKHSHLSQFPGIESCLVTLVAYSSYFFSNGLQMSG